MVSPTDMVSRACSWDCFRNEWIEGGGRLPDLADRSRLKSPQFAEVDTETPMEQKGEIDDRAKIRHAHRQADTPKPQMASKRPRNSKEYSHTHGDRHVGRACFA